MIYNSRYDYDLSGVQNNTGFAPLIPGTAIVPVTLQTQIPQSIEIKLQSGINERTLAFLNLKWQDWSQLGIIPIIGGVSPLNGLPTALSFDPLYQDGFTINAVLVVSSQRMFRQSLRWAGTAAHQQGSVPRLTPGRWLRECRTNQRKTSICNSAVWWACLTSGTSTPAPGGDAANGPELHFRQRLRGRLEL